MPGLTPGLLHVNLCLANEENQDEGVKFYIIHSIESTAFENQYVHPSCSVLKSPFRE